MSTFGFQFHQNSPLQSACYSFSLFHEQHDFDRNYKLEYVRNGKLENVRKFLLENVLEKLCCWKMSEIFLLENDLRKIECWKMS